ncbi:hypothetical protein TREES_T100019173 [Tupaia chinensis]|uniref:Uncharacterized protein n=1 Tax=Tupaia chinensis TaxID=246437 RepID=L9L947_TUPCH|nr:hypothetical protein TREES_T100019173 [Tupaia chinensis]
MLLLLLSLSDGCGRRDTESGAAEVWGSPFRPGLGRDQSLVHFSEDLGHGRGSEVGQLADEQRSKDAGTSARDAGPVCGAARGDGALRLRGV